MVDTESNKLVFDVWSIPMNEWMKSVYVIDFYSFWPLYLVFWKEDYFTSFKIIYNILKDIITLFYILKYLEMWKNRKRKDANSCSSQMTLDNCYKIQANGFYSSIVDKLYVVILKVIETTVFLYIYKWQGDPCINIFLFHVSMKLC